MADAAAAAREEKDPAVVKAEREARKKEKEAAQAKKKENKQQRAAGGAAAGGGGGATPASDAAAAAPEVEFISSALPTSLFGDYKLIQSAGQTGRNFTSVRELATELVGKEVWVRCRAQSVRAKGNSAFLVLRQGAFTVQGAMFKSDAITKDFLKFASMLSKESVVDVLATVAAADVRSCSQGNVELQIQRLYCVSRSAVLPLLIEDASRSEKEIEDSEARYHAAAEAAKEKEKEGGAKEELPAPFVRVNPDTRLDYRVIDLRVPAQNAMMRLQSAVCQLWRQALCEKDFVEIHTPKLIGGASEGGAQVFRLKYFDQDACLAQSPQLYKQMAICGDLHRVFEIGPVFRAELSNTHRHLCEFTGLDLEMEIFEHYFEALDMLDYVMSYIFNGLATKHKAEIALVSQQFPIAPFQCAPAGEKNLRLTHAEAIEILRKDGVEIGDFDDFTTEQEKRLGRLIKASHGTDFYSIHRFPDSCRPFYTMRAPDDDRYTNSYDIYMRGEEICSGAQRIHDAAMLTTNALSKGIPVQTIHHYIDSFKYGACPHGGGGVGLERVVMLFLGVNNIRKTSMFPRDPKRLFP